MDRRSHWLIALIFSLGLISAAYATPFTIVPNTPLPTVIAPGGMTSASYTVSNNTAAQRNIISVAYLPPSVTINNNVGCTTTFNLAPKGQPGSSCNLYLNINGPVYANDSDPYHHLFVCLPGNKTCVGTSYPLNVTQSNKLMAYVANNGTNTISICPVLASGKFGTCTVHSDPAFDYPSDVILNPTASIAYIANEGPETISWCTVNSNGTLNPCQSVPAPGLSDAGLTLNAAGNLLYYTNYIHLKISACSVNAQGVPSNCAPISPNLDGPDGRAPINLAGNLAYVPLFTTNTIAICPINANGTFAACTNNSDPAVQSPLGSIIDPMNSYLYVADYTNNMLAICPINTNGSLQICTAADGNGTFNFADNNAINMFFLNLNGMSYIYVPNGGTASPGNISMCPVQNGSLGTCLTLSDPSFNNPDGIWIANLTA